MAGFFGTKFQSLGAFVELGTRGRKFGGFCACLALFAFSFPAASYAESGGFSEKAASVEERLPGGLATPVIYLYPQKEQDVMVKLLYQGKFTTTYPSYDETLKGWKVKARSDGQLFNYADKGTYNYLFWEGLPNFFHYDFSTGYVVSGEGTADFLQKALPALGLNSKEANEFIVFWLPRMQKNKYNLIHFAGKEYTDVALLEVDPKPDSVIRVFMTFIPLDKKIDVPVQELELVSRKGFSVIEWGGTEVSSLKKLEEMNSGAWWRFLF